MNAFGSATPLHPDRAAPVAEVAKRHGISEVTIYAWRERFGPGGG